MKCFFLFFINTVNYMKGDSILLSSPNINGWPAIRPVYF